MSINTYKLLLYTPVFIVAVENEVISMKILGQKKIRVHSGYLDPTVVGTGFTPHLTLALLNLIAPIIALKFKPILYTVNIFY